jgi:uncharacterized protein (DUF433 family)
MDPTATQTQQTSTTTGTIPVLREHIVSTPDTCAGKPRIAGSRIQVKHVAIMHERQGMTPEAIVSEHRHLTLADIYAALAYYHDHREAINAEIVADREWYENRQGFSHREADEKSRLDEAIRRGMGGAWRCEWSW